MPTRGRNQTARNARENTPGARHAPALKIGRDQRTPLPNRQAKLITREMVDLIQVQKSPFGLK